MPYKSDAQRKWMHENHPEIAKKWDKEFPNQKGLPKRAAASDNAAFDVHSVDPRRLRSEIKKDMGLEPTGWCMKINEQCGIKYAGRDQYKVVYENQGRGIFNTETKAREVLKKYIARGN